MDALREIVKFPVLNYHLAREVLAEGSSWGCEDIKHYSKMSVHKLVNKNYHGNLVRILRACAPFYVTYFLIFLINTIILLLIYKAFDL